MLKAEPSPYVPDFAAKLAQLRLRIGLSREDLARLSGIHLDEVQEIEDRVRPLTAVSIVKFAKALDIQVQEFFEFGDS